MTEFQFFFFLHFFGSLLCSMFVRKISMNQLKLQHELELQKFVGAHRPKVIINFNNGLTYTQICHLHHNIAEHFVHFAVFRTFNTVSTWNASPIGQFCVYVFDLIPSKTKTESKCKRINLRI